MGSHRLKRDHTKLWILPGPPWAQLYEGPHAGGVRGLPTLPLVLEIRVLLAKQDLHNAQGSTTTSCSRLICTYTMCVERGLEEMLPPVNSGGTVEKEGRRSFFDCLCFFTTSRYLSPL